VNELPERPLRTRDEARALFRNAILDAAEAVFAENGFHGARIQDIAARARIAVGTVYNHFAQKDDVLRALLQERSEELLAELRPRPDDAPEFRARLEACAARTLAYVGRHRAFFAIASEQGLFAGSSAPGARLDVRPADKVAKFRAVYRELVDEGIRSGDLEPMDADALARFFQGTMRAFILASLAGEETDAAALVSMTVDLFLHGAARRPRDSAR
jgi:AcrR family transcriptional regulator